MLAVLTLKITVPDLIEGISVTGCTVLVCVSLLDSEWTMRNAFLQILLLPAFSFYAGTLLMNGWLGCCTLGELSESLIINSLTLCSTPRFFSGYVGLSWGLSVLSGQLWWLSCLLVAGLWFSYFCSQTSDTSDWSCSLLSTSLCTLLSLSWKASVVGVRAQKWKVLSTPAIINKYLCFTYCCSNPTKS